ncbi:MAG TPA: TlpA disulfide reductase family protein [Candidatus Acidoferrales bacterium]|nr:TlpA disulfide reductase family protein [Candidatus Acidoferrales bacterium]
MRMNRINLLGSAVLIALAATTFFVIRALAAARPAAERSRPAVAAKALDAQAQNVPVLYFAKDPEAAPPFLVRDLSGNVVSTPALKGKVVLLNFWATWCGPCREEIPEMIKLQSKYKDTLQIIGASEDEIPPEQVAKFAQKFGINYPVIMASAQLEREYGGVAALPTTFVINTDGRVVQKNVGVYPLEFYDMEVRSLMGMPVTARIETFKDTGQIFLKNAAHASELPGVSFAGLTPAQKKIALHRLNAQSCTCGCKLTLAECRINDTTCPISKGIANKIVREVASGKSGSSAPPAKASSTSRQ